MSWVQTVGPIRHKKPENMRQDRNAGDDGYVRNPTGLECSSCERFEHICAIIDWPSIDEQGQDDESP
jgi:hypothetical protein